MPWCVPHGEDLPLPVHCRSRRRDHLEEHMAVEEVEHFEEDLKEELVLFLQRLEQRVSRIEGGYERYEP